MTLRVVILLVVLCNTRAESGSGAMFESGEDVGNYATDKDGSSFMEEEEVQQEPLQSGEGDFKSDVDMDGLSSSASGMEPVLTVGSSSNNRNHHPTPRSTEPILSSTEKKTDQLSSPMDFENNNIFPTITVTEIPSKLYSPTTAPRLDLEDPTKQIRRKANYLKKRPRPSSLLDNLLKADNRSKHEHKHNERGYEYRRGQSSNTTKGPRMEYADVKRVIDEMEKLKKSKTDEELAKRIRKGARKVISSIAKKLVTKTTKTLAPHFGSLLQSNLKKDHVNETVSISFLPKKHKTRKELSLQNKTQVNETKQGTKKAEDSKVLNTKTKENGKTTKQEDFDNKINITVKGLRFNSKKKEEPNAEVSKQRNISKQGPVTRDSKMLTTKTKGGKKAKQEDFNDKTNRHAKRLKLISVKTEETYAEPSKQSNVSKQGAIMTDSKMSATKAKERGKTAKLDNFNDEINTLENKTLVNEIKQSAKKVLNQDSKVLETKTKESGKTAKQEDFDNKIHITVKGLRFNSIKKKEPNAEVSKQSNISKQGPVMRDSKMSATKAKENGKTAKQEDFNNTINIHVKGFHFNSKKKEKTNSELKNQSNTSKQGAVMSDSKVLTTKTKEKRKTAKPEDPEKINMNIKGIQFNPLKKKSSNAEASKQSYVSKQGAVMNVETNKKQSHANQREEQDKSLNIIGKQRSKDNHIDGNRNGKLRNVTTHVDSKSVGIEVFLKTPRTLKDKRFKNFKKYINKRTELITNPKPPISMLKTSGDNSFNLHQHFQVSKGAPPDGLNDGQVKMLHDKVNLLESEVTVLQTAVAGLVHRINDMERSFQEVSNVTQNEVIYGTTQASTTTSPTNSISSTHQPTPSFFYTTSQHSFPRGNNDGILPTQQPTATSQSMNNQVLSPEAFTVNILQTHRQLADMVHPTVKPSSLIQQLQMKELPTKQHLPPTKSSAFPLPAPIIQRLQMNEVPTKQHLPSSRSSAFPLPASIVQQLQMDEVPTKQHLPSSKSSAVAEQFYMKVLPASTVTENFPKQSLSRENLKDSMHNVHQIIVPLETLYKMQAQEGIQVPDDSHDGSRDSVEDNDVSTHSNTMFKDNTRKFKTPVNQKQQDLGMDLTQNNHNRDLPIRPIVNIIVPNSQAASILEKEMCWTPCKNGGKCNGRNTCQCPSPFYGNQCEHFSLYDFINEKAIKRPVNSVKRNSMPKEKIEQLSLNDLMRLGAKIRLTNGQVFRSSKKRLINTKRKLPLPKKQFIIET